MAINFPSSPTIGQVYEYQSIRWRWNGSAWDKYEVFTFNGLTANVEGVSRFNGLTGSVGITAGQLIDITLTGNTFTISSPDILYGISGSIYASSLATGLLYGGILSINGGNTAQFDITAGKGQIHASGSTFTSDPLPTFNYVTWPAQTGIPLTYLLTNDTTWIYIDGSGVLHQRTEYYTDEQLEENIIIGQLIHPSRSYISLARTNPNVAYATDKQYEQFIRSFGPIKISGHTISPNGANLKLNRTSGKAFSLGRNWINDTDNPSVVSDPAQTDCIFYRYYRGITAGTFITVPNQTVIDPANYDDGSGVLQAAPGGKYTIQRLFYYPNTPTLLGVYYGRSLYNSLADAAANINLENFTEIENTRTNAIFAGYLIVKAGATNLSNTSDALILQAGSFRSTTSGGGSVSLTLDDLTDVIITAPQDFQVLTYVDGVTGWENKSVSQLPLVYSLNGLTAGITLFGGSGIGVSSGGKGITVSNTGVLSFNGLTGTVTGVTTTVANTFTALQTFNSGISAAGVSAGIISNVLNIYGRDRGNTAGLTLIADPNTTLVNPVYIALSKGGASDNGSINMQAGTINISSATSILGAGDPTIVLDVFDIDALTNRKATIGSGTLTANRSYTFPDASGTFVLDTNISSSAVTSYNGRVGAVQGVSAAVAGIGISVSGATGSVTITNTGVQSFNGSTGAISGVNSVNGFTGALTVSGGTGISVLSAGKGITLVNTGVLSIDGGTGDITNVARTNTANIFTAVQTFNAGITTSGITLNGSITALGLGTFIVGITAAGATFTGDIAVNGGDITTTASSASLFNSTTNLDILNTQTAGFTLNIGNASSFGGVKRINIGGNISGGASSIISIGTNNSASNTIIFGGVTLGDGPAGSRVRIGTSNTGVNVNGESIFSRLAIFNAGISAAGGTLSGDIIIPSGSTLTVSGNFVANGNVNLGDASTDSITVAGLLTANAGITASGATFASDIRVNSVTVGRGGGNISGNIAIGEAALANGGNTGSGNIAVGGSALVANTSGISNTAIGTNALYTNTSGFDNIALGSHSLFSNTTGTQNTSIGASSLYNSTTGSENTGIGAVSLFGSVVGTTTLTKNVAVGRLALFGGVITNTQFINTTALGYEAGRYRGTGTDALASATGGIYIGSSARGSANAQINEIVIGTDAVGLGSNTAVIGATLQSAATIYGQLSLPGGITASGATLNGRITASGLGTFNAGITTSGITLNGNLVASGSGKFNSGVLTDFVAPTVGLGLAGVLHLNADETGAGGGGAVTYIGDVAADSNNTYIAVDDSIGEIRLFAPSSQIYTDGRINLNDRCTIFTAQLTTDTNTANQAIFNYSSSLWCGAEFIITAQQGAVGVASMKTCKILVANTSSTVNHTEYGEVVVGTDFVTFNVSISGGTVSLTMTPSGNSLVVSTVVGIKATLFPVLVGI